MNEDFLKALHANMGGDKVGSFEEFKNEFQSNVEFQKAVHANIGGDNVGSFDEFRSELFGAAPKKVNKKPTMQFAPEQEALLDAIADKESTGYDVIVGPNGFRFDDFSDHPRRVGVVTPLGPSTAAGMYQFTASTWDEVNQVLRLPDFGPDSQRTAALYYAQTRYKDLTGGRDIYEDISAGRLERIQQVLGGSGGATVWQGLQGDTEFANRYKSHLKRYQDQVKPPEPKTMQEAAQDLDSAMQGNKKMAESLQYNLGETTVEPTPKKVPEDMGKIKERLDQERVSLKAVDHDFKQKVSTRQDELRQQFETTPVFTEMNDRYAAEVQAHQDKFIKENVETSPEFIGLKQKLQDDVNSRVVTPEEASQKINEFISEKIGAEQSLKDLDIDINKRFSDEYNSVFQGYTSKDDILGSLIKQREDIWGQSTAFQTELINSYNSKIEEYNKQAQSQAQANQPKASKEVGLQGGGPYAPGQRPQDYTGGLIKINKTSSDYDKEEAELDAKFGLKKDAALAAWYTDQGREVPTQKAKDLTKKSTEYFKKGKEIKLKRYEALKQEIFTMSPIELGRAKIEDFTQKVQEYGDVQRGYFEQDNVAVEAYADELVKFREGADLKLSEKFGDKYNEFLEDQSAIEILLKSGRDVKDKVKKLQDKYSDVLEDDDYILSSREIPKLYQQAKFEQSQLADAYQQGERLKRVEDTQKYANENPVMAAIAGTLGKAIGAVTQTAGSLLEQAEKAPLLVKLIPGFAQLSGFLPQGSLEKGISELGEMGRVAGGDIKAGTPFSTKMQGQTAETYAVTPTGKRVIYNSNTGAVEYIRNEDGTIYEGYEADVIIESAKGVKKQWTLNPFSIVGQVLNIGADMIPTIALFYGTAGMGAAGGMLAPGVNVMSKVGMFMGGYSQGYSQAKEEALKQKGLSFDEIESFAVSTGLITGAIENFNPIEGKIFSKSLSKNVVKDNLLELAAGRVSGATWGTNIVLNFLKGGFKEAALEEVPQALADKQLKNYYNSKKGGEFATDISRDQWLDIIITSFGVGGIGEAMRSGSKSDLGKAALKIVVNNREMYDAYLSGMEKTSPEMAAKIRSDIDPLLSEIDSVDGLTPKRKEKSVELLYDIRTLESKLAPIVEPTLRKPIEDQIVELRKELGSVVSVPTDDYGDPVDEVAEVEKAAKEAEKTKGEVSKSKPTPTPKKPEEPPTPPAPAAAAVAVEEKETKPVETETKATFVETPKQALQDTQITGQGVESTQVEIVAPTQQAESQNANVLDNFTVKNTKGEDLTPKVYTKNEKGNWTAQTKKEDGTLSKGVPVSSANVVAQLDAESSKRAAESVAQTGNVGVLGDVESTTKALEDRGRTQSIEGDIIDKILLQKSKDLREKDGTVSDENLKEFKEVVSARASINAAIAIRPKSQGSKERYVLSNQEIAEAYHKAKADGSNPELVKAVESLLGTKPAAQTTTTKTKDKETLEQAVQRVDSTSVTQLDDIIARAKKDLATTKDKAKKEDIQQTIDSLTKTRDQLSKTQANTQTNKIVNDEKSNKENSSEKRREEGQVGTTVAEEQGQGQEGNTQEEVNTKSLQTKDPTQKAAQDLVTKSKETIDELSQDQAAAILDYMKGLKIDISGLKTDCKK